MQVGIEAMNVYGGPSYIDVRSLFKARSLDLERFDNLMMEKKAVGLPCEDVITNGVNAAKPIIDQLSEDEKNSIELLITSSESGVDFGKSISTYIHDYLGLNRKCRLFEVKQACYAGTASLQMASNFIMSQASPGAKVLVISTDTARAAVKNTYAEPSQATGAVAVLVSDKPDVLELDFGANGLYSYEVMDTCRPLPEVETGDPDLSLFSYLDCLENSYKSYESIVENADFKNTFDYLSFHTPFPGMVKGAHRKMMRKLVKAKPREIEIDYQKRVLPSFKYCVQIGNVYSATVFLSLSSTIDHAELNGSSRIGIFSYGSGCSSEFYSGLADSNSQATLSSMKIQENLSRRYDLTIEEYDGIIDQNVEWMFGVENKEVDITKFSKVYDHFFEGRNMLVLDKVSGYHRKYRWS